MKPMQRRAFLIGPNESGKSNFLDVFRFLHDITATNGGFVTAVGKPWRGGFAKLKSLAAKHHADIRICVRHPVSDDYNQSLRRITPRK